MTVNGCLLALLLILLPPGVQAASHPAAAAGRASATAYAGAKPAAEPAPAAPSGEEELPVASEEEEAGEPAEAAESEFKVVTMDEAAAYLAGGKAIFVDARSQQSWEMGHILGAIDVPSSDFEKGYAAAKARLPKSATIIVYCESAHCDQAVDVATKLKALGYQHILHYKAGWVIWDWSKKPKEKSSKYKDWR